MLPQCHFSTAGPPWPPSCLNIFSFPRPSWRHVGAIRKYLSQAATASHFYPKSSVEFWWQGKRWLFSKASRIKWWGTFKSLPLPPNKEKGLLVSCGNTNIQRSMMRSRSVTVCNACLWVKVLYKMLPFKLRWSAFNDLANRCAASNEAGSQL